MKESIVATSFKRFKRNSVSYISVGVFCAIFLVFVSLLSFVDEMVFFIAVPVLAFPFLFASHVSCYLLEVGQPINMSAFFRYFVSFFRKKRSDISHWFWCCSLWRHCSVMSSGIIATRRKSARRPKYTSQSSSVTAWCII